MGLKPDAPTPPDPYAVGKAQSTADTNTAIANTYLGNLNTISPQGAVNYVKTGETTVDGRQIPQFTQTTTLSPEQRVLYDQQNQLGSDMNDLALDQVGRLDDTLSSPFDLSGLPAGGSLGSSDYSADRQRVEDAIYSRLNPQIERDMASRRTELANQGINEGSQPYQTAMEEFGRNSNDARMQAILAGGAEQSRLFGMDLERYGADNVSRERAMQERLMTRNQPINEIGALMSGGQVSFPQMTQYRPGTVQNSNIGQNIYNSAALQNQQYQQQQQQQNAGLGGLFGLGGSLLAGGGLFG